MFTPPRNRGGVIFSLQFVCVCVCVSVCLSVCPIFLWTKFQPNGSTDLDAVFAKWLLITLARTLLNLMILGQRSRSRWPKMYVKMMKKDEKNSPKIQIYTFLKLDLIIRLEILLPSFWYQIWPYCTINNSKNYQWKFLKKYFWLKIFCSRMRTRTEDLHLFSV